MLVNLTMPERDLWGCGASPDRALGGRVFGSARLLQSFDSCLQSHDDLRGAQAIAA